MFQLSSMTGGCTYPIYYHGRVVSVENGDVIIRYKKKLARCLRADLIFRGHA